MRDDVVDRMRDDRLDNTLFDATPVMDGEDGGDPLDEMVRPLQPDTLLLLRQFDRCIEMNLKESL